MNTLIWIGQIALAAVFLITGFSKLIAYKKLVSTLELHPRFAPITMSPGMGRMVGLLEVLCAIGVMMPTEITPEPLAYEYLLVRLAAACLAVLMVGASIYHVRRRESAAPAIAAFLLALFVIVGRWPH